MVLLKRHGYLCAWYVETVEGIATIRQEAAAVRQCLNIYIYVLLIG